MNCKYNRHSTKNTYSRCSCLFREKKRTFIIQIYALVYDFVCM